jgi:fucose permease
VGNRAQVAPLLLFIAYASFITIGLPDGMLGVAWPTLRTDFGQPLGALGVLVTGFTLGYLATSFTIGAIVIRLSYGAVFVASGLAMAIGGVVMALAPVWIPVLLGAVILGAGVGLLDAGLNAFGADHFNSRQLNWLHAGFGVGATIGPMMMSGFLSTSLSWRGGYGAMATVALLATALFMATKNRWDDARHGAGAQDVPPGGAATPATAAAEAAPPPPRASLRDLKDPVVIGSALLFVLYAGVEVTAGQWAYSLFTIERGVDAPRAARWVSIYWGALTAGRIVFGIIADRVGPLRLLRITMAGAGIGAALFWIGTPDFLGAIGLLILGFSLAPMFPLLIGETPKRVGAHRSSFVVGLQMGGSSIGVMLLAGGMGLFVEAFDLNVVVPGLFAILILFVLTHELVLRASRR